MNQHAECPEGWPVTSHPSCASATAALDWGRQASFTDERRGYFSEYRYDALGRRVLVRTRRYGLCFASTANAGTVACTSGIERYVWAGDNILWELRGPGANTETAERLEQVDAVPQEYGIVGYTHAGGVDRPLVAYKTAGGNSGAVVVPHMNWRGLFSMGTNSVGGASTTPVEWPGFRTTANHSMGETQATTNTISRISLCNHEKGIHAEPRRKTERRGGSTETPPRLISSSAPPRDASLSFLSLHNELREMV